MIDLIGRTAFILPLILAAIWSPDDLIRLLIMTGIAVYGIAALLRPL